MFSSPSFSECFDTLTEEQKDDERRDRHHDDEEISRLPLLERWRFLPLRLYKGFWFPQLILPGVLSLRRHLRPAPSDIFLASFPKSGTTWLKALAFAITTRKPALLLSRHPQNCSPNLESFFAGHRVPDLDALPSPRQFSTHIPYSVLPKSVHDSPCRIIYLCREPKDTLVSTYHFVNEIHRPEAAGTQMPFTEAVELFCRGLSMYGSVWEHQLEYWKESQRRPDKVLFVKYEDMMADPEAVVRRMAEFIGKPFSPAEDMKGMVGEIVGLCSFNKLSGLEINKIGLWGEELHLDLGVKNSSFFRKGKVGDWREHFTVEMAERFDAIARDKLLQSGLTHSHSSV